MADTEAFKDWLKRKMEARMLNQTELALDLDVNSSVISRWLRGSQRPNVASARKVADFFGVRRDEVLTIVFGDRLFGQDDEVTDNEQPRPLNERMREAFAEILPDLPIAIPIHDQAASAGFGQTVLEYAYWEPPRVAGRNIVGVRVHGNSMEPEIMDGDTVYIDKDLPAEAGKIVVATLGDQVLVKKLRRKGGKLILSGTNGEWDAADAKIEGVVIQLSRDVR